MTTRPKHSRPNSAVYLGSDPLVLASTPPGIPDLPEPPSPVSSNGSGLPSPPATNSTGSGSTGDPASIALRSTKRSTTSMLNAANVKAFHAAFTHERLDDNEDDDNDHDLGNENDEDDTARLNRRHSLKTNENTLAIQRALSLKERTKMTIDKLSSYSRMNTPSPHTNPRHSLPSFTASDSSSSSSSRRQQPEPHHSGSETEREQPDAHSRPSTPRRNRTRLISAPASPGKALLGLTSTHSSSSNSSNSPSKPRKRSSMATSEFAELTGRRIRSPETYETPQNNRHSTDIAQAAMAAVALSRGRLSPTNSKKRQPLPKEFMDASTASGSASGSGSNASVSRRGSLSSSRHLDDDDDRNHVNGSGFVEPSTPHHNTTMPRAPSTSGSRYLQLSPRQQRNLNSTLTDPRPTTGRSATVRRHQTGGRWMSEDMSSVTSSSRGGDDEYDGLPSARGRMQTVRASGSAESALTIGAGGAGRSLIGEGLKAAGLSNGSMTVGRRGGADVFDDTPLRDRDRLTRDRERAVRIERIERSMSRTRSRSRVGWDEDGEDVDVDDAVERRRPGSQNRGSDIRTRAGTVIGPRAATSMAEYRAPDREREGVGGNEAIVRGDVVGGGDEPRTAPPQLRSYKSTYDLPLRKETGVTPGGFERDKEYEREKDRERERTQSSLSRYASVASPFGSRRFESNPIPSQNQQPSSRGNGSASSTGKQGPDRSDHTRLLQDSLRMFETHVSRVPSTSSATAGDLLRNAQNIVSSAEKLNALLRAGTTRALDAQIEAEVDETTGKGESVADVWRRVGGEYREGLRYSDDLMRSVTDFLLGVGRAVKDMTGGNDGHGRSISLDEEGLSLGGRLTRSSMSPDVTGGSSGSGRRSAESRRSWGEDLKRLSTGARTTTGSRPPSALNLMEGREVYETPPAPSVRPRQPQSNGIASNGTASSSTRRLLSPREIRDQQLDKGLSTFDSGETLHAYDPSPTPASRTQQARNQTGATIDRSRTLPPLSIPQPLPTLPSESQTRRQNQTNQTDKTPASSSTRRRPTISGASTLRGSVFPSISPNVPTTALTPHTVSNSPERAAFPMLRADSSGSADSGSGGKSAGATPRSTVTFSRSSTVSALTGLQQAQQKQRQRTTSSTSSNADADVDVGRPAAVERIVRTASGSETERDIRRSTVSERSRISLDGSGTINGNAHPADRSAASAFLTGRSKERRRSVVDVWSRGGGR